MATGFLLAAHGCVLPNFKPYYQLFCSVSTCRGSVLRFLFSQNSKSRAVCGQRSRGERVAEQGWTNTHWHIDAEIHTHTLTHRHTNWLPVNTNKSSSSSWNRTMKQLWVPAEPDSPTHWASLRQTHTHARTHWYSVHTTQSHTKPHTHTHTVFVALF